MLSNKQIKDLKFFSEPDKWLLTAVSSKLRFGLICILQTIFMAFILRELDQVNTALLLFITGYIFPLAVLHAVRRILCAPNNSEKEDIHS